MKPLFVCYPKCTTCQKAEKWLKDNGIEYTLRDIKTHNPTQTEIGAWYNQSGLELKKFFNTSGLIYKNNNIKEKLADMTENQQLELLATDGMLVKRPILVADKFVLVGFNQEKWQQAFGV